MSKTVSCERGITNVFAVLVQFFRRATVCHDYMTLYRCLQYLFISINEATCKVNSSTFLVWTWTDQENWYKTRLTEDFETDQPYHVLQRIVLKQVELVMTLIFEICFSFCLVLEPDFCTSDQACLWVLIQQRHDWNNLRWHFKRHQAAHKHRFHCTSCIMWL